MRIEYKYLAIIDKNEINLFETETEIFNVEIVSKNENLNGNYDYIIKSYDLDIITDLMINIVGIDINELELYLR